MRITYWTPVLWINYAYAALHRFWVAALGVVMSHSHKQMFALNSHTHTYRCTYVFIWKFSIIFFFVLFCHIIGIISMYVYAEYSYIIYIHIDACMYMLLCISKTCVCVCKCFQCHDSWHSVTRLCACCKLKLIVFMHKKIPLFGHSQITAWRKYTKAKK